MYQKLWRCSGNYRKKGDPKIPVKSSCLSIVQANRSIPVRAVQLQPSPECH